jgi:hypothetical protein
MSSRIEPVAKYTYTRIEPVTTMACKSPYTSERQNNIFSQQHIIKSNITIIIRSNHHTQVSTRATTRSRPPIASAMPRPARSVPCWPRPRPGSPGRRTRALGRSPRSDAPHHISSRAPSPQLMHNKDHNTYYKLHAKLS